MSRVLLVTIILIGRSGTEVVCCETARGLRKRGHDVSIYTQQDGPSADRLRAEGFEVTTDLASLTSIPEVIQANQTYPLLEAVGRFPCVPAISICHDATVWYNEPIDLPSIRRHVAVDLVCHDRIVGRFPHLGGRVQILRNAVDLDHFRPRAALPERPKRALILAKHSGFLDAVRSACLQRGIDVDTFGPAIGNEVDDLSSRLGDYDLVFATARSALEAMASGCAVIVVDGRGLAGLVTREVVSSWHQNNFGLRLLSRGVSTASIVDEIDRYDAADVRLVTDFIRGHSSLDGYLDRLEDMHRDVMAEGASIDDDGLIYRMSQSFRSLATAQQVQTQIDFQHFAVSREAELQAEFQSRAGAREAELRAEFRDRTSAREAELRAEYQNHAAAKEAEFRAEFQACKDSVAPRNLGRRLKDKVRLLLFRA